MKILLLLAALLFNPAPEPSLLILDKNLKKPLQQATGFTLEEFLQQRFPIYAADKAGLADAITVLAKKIENNMPCYTSDTITLKNSQLILSADCTDWRKYSIMLSTYIPELNTSYNMRLLEGLDSKRKAQQKLLNFAAYLNQ